MSGNLCLCSADGATGARTGSFQGKGGNSFGTSQAAGDPLNQGLRSRQIACGAQAVTDGRSLPKWGMVG
jgi:hypothetical protein